MTLTELFLCCVNEHHKRRLQENQRAQRSRRLRNPRCRCRLDHPREPPGGNSVDRTRLTRKLIETEIAALEAIIKKDSTRYDAITEKYDPSVPRSASSKHSTQSIEDAGPLLERARSSFPRRRQAVGFSQENDDERPDGSPLHVDTLNDKLVVVRKFFRWAENREKREKNVPNPIDGLLIKRKRERGKKCPRRCPFSVQELQKLFHGPIYTGCKSPYHWKEPGTLVPRDLGALLGTADRSLHGDAARRNHPASSR